MSRITAAHIGIEQLSAISLDDQERSLPGRYALLPDGQSIEALYRDLRVLFRSVAKAAGRSAMFQSIQVGARLPAHATVLGRLSEREFEAFLGLARGQSVQQLAEAMQLSASTVGTYLYNIKQKLGLQNQAEMTLLAVREGLIEP